MAQSKRNPAKYVYDIPYFERMELCRILDQNDKWEELGGVYMNFDVLTIQTLRREILRGNSPTDELLTKWGHQNHTILELFVLLSKMQHYQAMLVIKPFVDSDYHRLIYEGEQNLNRLFRPKEFSKHNVTNTLDQNISQPPTQNDIQNLDNGVAENKIINGQGSPLLRNSRNNAQTALMNRAETAKNSNQHNQIPSKFLKQDAAKDKTNVSEISSIAERVGILPVITFKELEIATNGWDHSTILGKGGFGTVYKGTWKNTSVAIKRTKNSEADEAHSIQIQQILGELKMLNSYRHDNILPLYGFSIDGEDPCLIYQFMPNGSLEDRLLCRHGTKPLSWSQRLNIATGTARGIQFLHTIGEKPLIHGDIKSANILLGINYEPKIGDFGLAREGPYNHYTHMKVSRVHGTRPYLPDEFLRHKKFSTKVDTHSFGVVLFELATGLRAYDEQRQNKFLKDLVESTLLSQLNSLSDKKCGTDEHTFSNLIALGKQCVSKKPKDRPEMVVVLQELNSIVMKRSMIVKVQSAIRQNSPTPSAPFEMQVFYDLLSQQKKVTPSPSNSTNHRAQTKIFTPPFQQPHIPDFQGVNCANPIEVEGANGANLNFTINNNPFLPLENSKLEKKILDVRDIGVLNANTIKENESECTNENVTSKKINHLKAFHKTEYDNLDVKHKPPVISISPPTTSRESSELSEDNAVASPRSQITEGFSDYEYTSDIENFLPLISVLGVKGKTEETKGGNKMEQTNSDQSKSEPLSEVDTSAKGKPLWILHE